MLTAHTGCIVYDCAPILIHSIMEKTSFFRFRQVHFNEKNILKNPNSSENSRISLKNGKYTSKSNSNGNKKGYCPFDVPCTVFSTLNACTKNFYFESAVTMQFYFDTLLSYCVYKRKLRESNQWQILRLKLWCCPIEFGRWAINLVINVCFFIEYLYCLNSKWYCASDVD